MPPSRFFEILHWNPPYAPARASIARKKGFFSTICQRSHHKSRESAPCEQPIRTFLLILYSHCLIF